MTRVRPRKFHQIFGGVNGLERHRSTIRSSPLYAARYCRSTRRSTSLNRNACATPEILVLTCRAFPKNRPATPRLLRF
jgi:hypothetical protein